MPDYITDYRLQVSIWAYLGSQTHTSSLNMRYAITCQQFHHAGVFTRETGQFLHSKEMQIRHQKWQHRETQRLTYWSPTMFLKENSSFGALSVEADELAFIHRFDTLLSGFNYDSGWLSYDKTVIASHITMPPLACNLLNNTCLPDRVAEGGGYSDIYVMHCECAKGYRNAYYFIYEIQSIIYAYNYK